MEFRHHIYQPLCTPCKPLPQQTRVRVPDEDMDFVNILYKNICEKQDFNTNI
jgi:hypothetical protein